MPTGTQKLASNINAMKATCDSIRGSVERIGRAQSLVRAAEYLHSPPPSVQAIRDRAAFDQAWADRTERERQKLRDTQAAAVKFYGRA